MDSQRIGLELYHRVVEINQAILVMSSLYGISTAATLSVVLIAEQRYYIVHVGDSRVYALRGKKLCLLTEDHSRNGKLFSSIGRNQDAIIFYDEGSPERLSFLLCTDGLYNSLSDSFLVEQIFRADRRTIRKRMTDLVDFAIRQGESDNISLVLALNEER